MLAWLLEKINKIYNMIENIKRLNWSHISDKRKGMLTVNYNHSPPHQKRLFEYFSHNQTLFHSEWL